MIIHFVFYTQWMTEPTKKVKNTVHAEDNFGKVFFLKFERDYLHWVGKDKAKSKTKAFKNPDNLLNISTRQNSPSSGQLVQRFAHCICKADGSLKRKISLFGKSWLYVQNKMFKSMKKRNHTKKEKLREKYSPRLKVTMGMYGFVRFHTLYSRS